MNIEYDPHIGNITAPLARVKEIVDYAASRAASATEHTRAVIRRIPHVPYLHDAAPALTTKHLERFAEACGEASFIRVFEQTVNMRKYSCFAELSESLTLMMAAARDLEMLGSLAEFFGRESFMKHTRMTEHLTAYPKKIEEAGGLPTLDMLLDAAARKIVLRLPDHELTPLSPFSLERLQVEGLSLMTFDAKPTLALYLLRDFNHFEIEHTISKQIARPRKDDLLHVVRYEHPRPSEALRSQDGRLRSPSVSYVFLSLYGERLGDFHNTHEDAGKQLMKRVHPKIAGAKRQLKLLEELE